MTRGKMSHESLWILFGIAIFALVPKLAFSQTIPNFSGNLTAAPVQPVANPCPRFNAGSVVQDPPSLFSQNGVLTVNFSYQTTTDSAGRTLFCFMTPDGLQNPTLHVNPGDHLVIKVTNNTPALPVQMAIASPNCGAAEMTGSSVNIHYHGTNTSPTCGQDEVIRTLINSGQTFQYNVAFPTDEPPGLYWYHPHVHGISDLAVQGGASGAIVVDGIENVQPAVAGLRERMLIIRDQNVPGKPTPGGTVPSWDVTLNDVPINSCQSCPRIFTPAVIQMESGKQEFWRVSNSSADTIVDLQLQFNDVPQQVQLVALDGVAVNSQGGPQPGSLIPVNHVLIPPAGRAEFIVPALPSTVQTAQLVTAAVPTGPYGDNDPERPLATIEVVNLDGGSHSANSINMGTSKAVAMTPQRFSGLSTTPVAATRTLYFSENANQTQFYITVDGQTPQVFDPNMAPAIVATQGSVEDWIIQNRSLENHEFHIHQVHFLVRSQNNFLINGSQPDLALNGQVMDMIQIPYWDGNPDHPYPSVTVRIDFRGPDVGDFVYHCHILNHEDLGMMAIVRVLPPGSSNSNTSGNALAKTTVFSEGIGSPGTGYPLRALGSGKTGVLRGMK